METWFVIVVGLCVSALLKSVLEFIFSGSKSKSKSKSNSSAKLPPGPSSVPIIGSLIWLKKSFSELEAVLRSLFAKYGPVVTVYIGSRPTVFIRDRQLAHRTLVQNGAVFSDRPPALPNYRFITSNQHNISSAAYGPTWRLLRRNLTSEMLHPSRVGSYSFARKRVLEILLGRLKSHAKSGEPVRVIDHFQYCMFCLLVLMCFGDRVDEKQIGEIEAAQRRLLLNINRFNILNFWPRVGKILFRKMWLELYDIRQNQENVYAPHIEARKKMKLERSRKASGEDQFVLSYVDSLLDLQLPHENRSLTDGEIVSLCSEFLSAGTDTTSTSLHWIMANMVKSPEIQEKLFADIKAGMENSGAVEVRERDLQKMPYLKAVVLEGLRRHPPGHFVLPHAVTEDVTVEGYLVPKKGMVNFMVAEMALDPEVWEEPMAFKPERFMSADGKRLEAFDVTGSKEIKMMPFGVGRRICAGYTLAMLHLEYFVANLIWNFKWTAVDGEEVDLSEKQEFTVVMKTPLNAQITERSK